MFVTEEEYIDGTSAREEYKCESRLGADFLTIGECTRLFILAGLSAKVYVLVMCSL